MSTHYVVTWRDPKNGEILALKADTIRDSTLGLTFVSISDFRFDTERAIVNPQEEEMARRYANTRALHLSIHAIVSIEEVGADHKGLTFDKDRSNLLIFPPTDRK